MRRMTAVSQTKELPIRIPRGWVILGAALASWAVFVSFWTGLSQVFAFVLAAV